jgi:hypothetical protein
MKYYVTVIVPFMPCFLIAVLMYGSNVEVHYLALNHVTRVAAMPSSTSCFLLFSKFNQNYFDYFYVLE